MPSIGWSDGAHARGGPRYRAGHVIARPAVPSSGCRRAEQFDLQPRHMDTAIDFAATPVIGAQLGQRSSGRTRARARCPPRRAPSIHSPCRYRIARAHADAAERGEEPRSATSRVLSQPGRRLHRLAGLRMLRSQSVASFRLIAPRLRRSQQLHTIFSLTIRSRRPPRRRPHQLQCPFFLRPHSLRGLAVVARHMTVPTQLHRHSQQPPSVHHLKSPVPCSRWILQHMSPVCRRCAHGAPRTSPPSSRSIG